MRANWLLGIVIAMTLTATVASGSVAGAANLEPSSPETLGAWVVPGGTGAPNVITWANFTGVTGTNLSGKALNGPGSWVVGTGTWTIQANTAASTSAAVANMSVSAGTNSASVLATINIGASARAGLVANDNGTNALYTVYSKKAGGTIQLYKFVGGSTLLASATGVGAPASAVLELNALTSTIKVSFAGTVWVTYTLTAAEVTALRSAGANRFGLVADSDNVTRFDDFHVDN